MKIVLLTHDSWQSRALAAFIKQKNPELTRVIFEDKKLAINPQTSSLFARAMNRLFLRRLYAFIDWCKTPLETQRLLAFEKKLKAEAQLQVKDYIQQRNLRNAIDVNHWPLAGVSCDYVVNLNSEESLAMLQQEAPDLCVVYATSILKQELLSIPKIATLNVHCSLLPEYRGTSSEFFQCYDNNYAHAGITIHQVDCGVDTGKILFQKKADMQPGHIVSPYYLRALNTIAMFEHYPTVIRQVLEHKISAYSQGPSHTPVFKSKDATLDKKLTLLNRLYQKNNRLFSKP